jgi:hypothetical protein
VRYKKPEDIPLALLGELAARMTVPQWIRLYEERLRR